MSRFIEPVTLRGTHATLEPLSQSHVAGLASAATDGDLHDLWYTSVANPSRMQDYVGAALKMRDEQGAMPFAARRSGDGGNGDGDGGDIVGSTRYFNVDAKNRRLEIGHTWYAKRVQRTAFNTECKLLLLAHAFDTLGCIAVEFRTHWFNFASRAAITRLGAKQDGVLRNHQVLADGSKRDTVVFSIIDNEWPAVRRHLQFQMQKPR
jgi:RimJ/RimL family protein N-acetyltransferase